MHAYSYIGMPDSVMVHSVATWSVPVLQGALVRLEPLGLAHGDGLWEASRDTRTWEWLPIPRPPTRSAFDAWLESALAAARAGTELPLATIRGGQPVGSTRFLALRPAHRSVEIGWTWLHPDAWGTGINIEAKLLMLEHAFEAWTCRRVELKTDALNVRSRGAMEALGATFEGVHRKHMLVRGEVNRDSAWYAILDDEWPAVREGLRRRLDE
jgi:N-acetyltransferase